MDATAISLCMDNKLPIVVFNLRHAGQPAARHHGRAGRHDGHGLSAHAVATTADGRRMDVSDLKGLFAEVKKRMDGADRARAPRARRRAHRPRVGDHPRRRARRGLRLADAAQPGGVAVDPRADADRRAAVRSVADRRRSRRRSAAPTSG